MDIAGLNEEPCGMSPHADAPSDQVAPGAFDLLVHAPFGRDRDTLVALAREREIASRGMRSLAELVGALPNGFGALVLTEESFSAGIAPLLTRALHEQPSWAASPILALVEDMRELPEGVRHLRESEVQTHLLLLERPVPAEEFISAVQALLRARAAQYAIRDQLLALEARNRRLDFLMAELDHRVKNVLAKVSSIAALTSSQAPDLSSFTVAFNARVAAMARAHDMLAGEGHEPVVLRDLIREALGPFANPSHSNIRMRGPEVPIWPNSGMILAMVLHELATNAAQYGALSVPEGQVTVEWSRHDGVLVLEWHETDGPPVTRPRRRSFGSTLIESAAPHELEGEVDLRFEPEGVRCRITCPVPDT